MQRGQGPPEPVTVHRAFQEALRLADALALPTGLPAPASDAGASAGGNEPGPAASDRGALAAGGGADQCWVIEPELIEQT